ncbi:MAG: nucleotidyl transferase AbiEii/AbiGii toxin family protein [Candidatus Micrarchaeota archaeon]
MDELFNRKYKKVLEVLPDVAGCSRGKLILVGGTALALFYLNHRVSVDMDFVPLEGSETRLKEELKGCMTKKGYRTTGGAYKNQFVVQFEDTSIKVEVFSPEHKLKRFEERVFGNAKIPVASIDDLLRLKIKAYENRREARDLFDVFCITKKRQDSEIVKRLISKYGMPKNIQEVESFVLKGQDFELFCKVIENASKTGG